MLFARESNEWGYVAESSADGTRPATLFGTSVTPGTNAYGSAATLINGTTGGDGGGATEDAYAILINVNGVTQIASAAHDSLVTIQVGGVDVISHLVCGPASAYTVGGLEGGVWFCFPLFIKGGLDIAAKASRSSGTDAFNVQCSIFCRPSRPELVRAGTFVRTFGEDTANSRGTAITEGTTSEGAYTEIGTLADTLWYWEFGYGITDTTINFAAKHIDIDIGDATNKKKAIRNACVFTSSIETISKFVSGQGYRTGVSGDKVYARAQTSTILDAITTVACYGVGGSI